MLKLPPGSVTIIVLSSITWPLETISKRSVSWLKLRKEAILPAGRPLMFGYSIWMGGRSEEHTSELQSR